MLRELASHCHDALCFVLSASVAFAFAPQPQLAGPYVAYLPIAEKPATPTVSPTLTTPPPVPTVTPTPLPPSYNACAADPYAGSAPHDPVRIVAIDKVGETVTIRNVSTTTISITGWRICSITGNQLHATLTGGLLPGETRVIVSQAGGPIWNNSNQDDGALYAANGSLVSYWMDEGSRENRSVHDEHWTCARVDSACGNP